MFFLFFFFFKQKTAYEMRISDWSSDVCSSDLHVLDALVDQVALHGDVILEIDLGLAARRAVERRLGDVEIALLDDLGHLPEEEGEEQRADMRAVDVRVRHDEDLVVADPGDVELLADAGAERGDRSEEGSGGAEGVGGGG